MKSRLEQTGEQTLVVFDVEVEALVAIFLPNGASLETPAHSGLRKDASLAITLIYP